MMFEYNFSDIEFWGILTSLFILRYVFIAGLFYLIFYKWKKKKWLPLKFQNKFPTNIQIGREIRYSILTFFIYGLGIWCFLYWINNGMTKMYFSLNTYGIGYFVLSIVLMILIHDTYFYWTHRLIHQRNIFKKVHKIHHSFHNPTPWAAFAFHPFEAIISLGVLPIILFSIPIHQLALVIFITFLTIYNGYIHLGISVPQLQFFKWQNTSKEHDMHHNGTRGNFGLYFTFWDKVMGTYKLPES